MRKTPKGGNPPRSNFVQFFLSFLAVEIIYEKSIHLHYLSYHTESTDRLPTPPVPSGTYLVI